MVLGLCIKSSVLDPIFCKIVGTVVKFLRIDPFLEFRLYIYGKIGSTEKVFIYRPTPFTIHDPFHFT